MNERKPLRTLACFGLFSPMKSGMVDYTEDLAAELSGEFDLVFYHDEKNVPTVAGQWGDVRPASEFKNAEDMALYQICNNIDLSYQYDFIKHHGGVVTLHDEVLYDLVYGAYHDRWNEYWKELVYNERLRGLWYLFQHPKLSRKAYGEQIRRNLFEHPDKRTRFPCRRRMASSAFCTRSLR